MSRGHGTCMGTTFSRVELTSHKFFHLDRRLRPYFSHFTKFRRHGSRGEGEREVESIVYLSAGDMELPWGLSFSHGDTTSQTLSALDRKFRSNFSYFISLHPLSAPWPERGRYESVFCWCPHTRSVVGSMGTPHLTTKRLKMAANKSKIGIFDSFPGFRRHGARGEGVGEGESMVSPCAGHMEPPWGPFFSRRDTTSSQTCTFDCKNTLCCSPIRAPWGRGEG